MDDKRLVLIREGASAWFDLKRPGNEKGFILYLDTVAAVYGEATAEAMKLIPPGGTAEVVATLEIKSILVYPGDCVDIHNGTKDITTFHVEQPGTVERQEKRT